MHEMKPLSVEEAKPHPALLLLYFLQALLSELPAGVGPCWADGDEVPLAPNCVAEPPVPSE